jgi:hypothetical protein
MQNTPFHTQNTPILLLSLPVPLVVIPHPEHPQHPRPLTTLIPVPKRHPPANQVENKLEKRGVFSDASKHTSKTPCLPRNPPQLHHDFTTVKQSKSAKPPAKTRFYLAKIF